VTVAEAQATLETALALLKELGHRDITAFADALREKLPQLLAPLEWLDSTCSLSCRIWMPRPRNSSSGPHRQAVNLNIATDLPEELHAVVSAVWDILGLFHPSSSLEALYSWLRPYSQIHRGCAGGCCPCCNSR